MVWRVHDGIVRAVQSRTFETTVVTLSSLSWEVVLMSLDWRSL